jgi:holo-[acyl-carrier protein] synthase
VILGIGIDLVTIMEIQNQIDEIDGYVHEVFTPHEIEYCQSRPNPYCSFAARFAAKEAFMKAAGTGWTDEIDFLEIEVFNDGVSRPTMHLSEKAIAALKHLGSFSMHVSLSHTESLATAVVMLDQ